MTQGPGVRPAVAPERAPGPGTPGDGLRSGGHLASFPFVPDREAEGQSLPN